MAVDMRLKESCAGISLLLLSSIAAEAATAQPDPKPMRVLTVCEVLENLKHYRGREVAVVGRLSFALFDGSWLSEEGCGKTALASDPHWPHAIFLSCFGAPAAKHSLERDIDESMLESKLKRLRRTTKLGTSSTLWMSAEGKKGGATEEKECWWLIVGRIESRPLKPGQGYGAVRAQTSLCSTAGSGREIRDDDIHVSTADDPPGQR